MRNCRRDEQNCKWRENIIKERLGKKRDGNGDSDIVRDRDRETQLPRETEDSEQESYQ